MELADEQVGTATVVSVTGRIDGSNARDFEAGLMSSIGGNEGPVVVDLSALAYISSAGLRVFLVAAKHMQESTREFALCALSAEVAEVFEITGFDSIINLHNDRNLAVDAVSS